MSPITKIALIVLFTICLGGTLYWYEAFYHNHYNSGDEEVFKLDINETFVVKIKSNGSTGYRNCWINEGKCIRVKKVSETYAQPWWKKNYDGVGGTSTWTFQAVKPGIDTIKISYCPTGPKGVDCSYFKEDSTMVDYTFIVKVSPF